MSTKTSGEPPLLNRTFVEDSVAEEVADAVLKAAGSAFRHYMPASKERIITETVRVMRDIAARKSL